MMDKKLNETTDATLEDWAHELPELFALEEEDSVATKELRTPRPPCARQQRLELEATIRELTQQIEAKKRRRRNASQRGASVEAAALQTECRSIVKRQKSESLRAHVENVKLRKLVEAQRESANKMEKLVSRALQVGRVLPLEPVVSFDLYQGPMIAPLNHVADLAELFDGAAQVFAADAHQDRRNESYRTVKVHKWDPDSFEGIDVILEMGWALPFNIDDVTAALWTHATRMVSATNSIHRKDIHIKPGELVSRFISVPRSWTAMPLSHGQIATKVAPTQLCDSSRLIVSRVYAHNIGGVKWLRFLRVSNWIRIERAHTGAGRPLSRIKWTRRAHVRPLNYETMSRSEWIKWVRNSVKGPLHFNVEQNLDHSVQSIENSLVLLRLQ